MVTVSYGVTMMNIAILLLVIILLILMRVVIIQLNVLQSSIGDLKRHIMNLEDRPSLPIEGHTKYRTNAGDTSKPHDLYD